MQKIPFVNYKRCYQKHKKEIDKAITKCLTDGQLILRDDVEQFEQKVSEVVGMKYTVGLNSGTDALYLALKALGIGKGDEVITVSHTFIATIAAIHNVGATPVLVDIDENMLMDLKQVKKKITKRTKAIMPVHMNGAVVDIKELKKIVGDMVIIEDSAQAFAVPTTSDGDIKCFSFYPAKMLGCYGDAGALSTNDQDIYEKVKVLRDNAQKRLKGGQKIEEAMMVDYGYNSRLDNIQATILNVKLKYFKQWLKRRYEIVDMYNKAFGFNWKTPQNYIYLTTNRDKMKEYLTEQGIETLVRDQIPNHKHLALGLNCSLPNTEALANLAIALPLYPELTNSEVKYIIKKVLAFKP